MSFLAIFKAARERRAAGGGDVGAPMPLVVAGKTVPDLIAQYRVVLARLRTLDQRDQAADHGECAAAIQEQVRLCDELGPAFAEAVGRQWRRDHADQIGACRWCGGFLPDHDVDHDGAPCRFAPPAA